MEGYTKEDIKAAHRVYKARSRLGNLSQQDLERMVRTQSVTNLDTTPRDMTNSSAIYGPHLPGVRGKTVREVLSLLILIGLKRYLGLSRARSQ